MSYLHLGQPIPEKLADGSPGIEAFVDSARNFEVKGGK
jgi:hypothetical protein